MDGLAFIESAKASKLAPVYVLYGDEDFLKRQALDTLRRLVFGADGDEFGYSSHEGDKATFAAITAELETVAFLGSRRLVVVDNADAFVTKNRALLEKFISKPAGNGILVLVVKSWPSNTKLYKMAPQDGSISCKAPPTYKLPEWCGRWASSRHQKQLSAPAAKLLVDLIGDDMGLLDQEIVKLAIYAGKANRIDADDVDKLVGSSREESTFKIFDAIAANQAGAALNILERVLDQGDDPIRVLGAFSMQLRRLAQAGRLAQQGTSLSAALDQVGVPPFAKQSCEQQLRHLGRARVDKLYDWLLEVDLGMKGSSQLSPRTLLERLVVRLAKPK